MIKTFTTPNRMRHRFTVYEYETMIRLGILTEDHPVELIRGEVVIRNAATVPYRFTPDDRRKMIQHGILAENDQIELSDGEPVQKMPIDPPHSSAVKRLNRLFARIFGDRVTIGCQDPIQLPDSEPQPDISLMKFRDDFYANEHPRPSDIFLVIEVADSSLDDDRNVKAIMYAEASIVEYWIVNLNELCLEVNRSPQADGTFADKQILQRDQLIEIQALPGTTFNVGDLV